MAGIRRPGATIDTLRLGHAVSYPGIDPRHWISLGYITAIVIDPNEGPIVDVLLEPMGATMPARVGSTYAGGGFGDWCPLQVDDEVIVEAPDGEPANGLIITARLWSPADVPPDYMVSNPGDRLIQSMPGTTLRIIADQINLGTGDASQASMRGTLYRANQQTMDGALVTQLTALAAATTLLAAAMTTQAGASTGPLAPLAAGFTSAAAAATAMALAATNSASAVTTFENGDTSQTPYLQPQVAVP